MVPSSMGIQQYGIAGLKAGPKGLQETKQTNHNELAILSQLHDLRTIIDCPILRHHLQIARKRFTPTDRKIKCIVRGNDD